MRSRTMATMFGDVDLFGDEVSEPAEESNPHRRQAPAVAARWQIDLLRKGLDSRGIVDLVERQQLIEGVVGRPVESLKTLTYDEALSVLKQFGESAPATRSGSTWDERDEDTWIDRL